jgi:AraC-like DNA-binding protein
MHKEFSYKQIGIIPLQKDEGEMKRLSEVDGHIKMLFLQKGSSIGVDFNHFTLDADALFFINPRQVLRLVEDDKLHGTLLYFNRDFYCIQIHDQEVSCDGILYNNVFETPHISLSPEESTDIKKVLAEIKSEMNFTDTSTEEMLRVLLKHIIIKSTRIWKQKHQLNDTGQQSNVEFLRKFSQLVEQKYKTHHTVADYAEILSMTPKNLNKKITQLGKSSPNEIIKDRIILESKRLLAHTALSVKEIAHNFNYDDDAYFIRFFTKNTGISPQQFRKQYATTQ